MDDQIEEMLNNKYLDIFEIQETLKQINTLEFEKFSINDKYELYNKIIDLYKYFYKDINEISKYEPRGPRTGGASGDSTPRRNDEDSKINLIYSEQLTYQNLLNESTYYDIECSTTQIKFKPTSLYNGYICYCKHNGENAISNKYFGFDLKNKYNIKQTKSGNNRWYCLDLSPVRA